MIFITGRGIDKHFNFLLTVLQGYKVHYKLGMERNGEDEPERIVFDASDLIAVSSHQESGRGARRRQHNGLWRRGGLLMKAHLQYSS